MTISLILVISFLSLFGCSQESSNSTDSSEKFQSADTASQKISPEMGDARSPGVNSATNTNKDSLSQRGSSQMPLTDVRVIREGRTSLLSDSGSIPQASSSRIVGEASIYRSRHAGPDGWSDAKVGLHAFRSEPTEDSITVIPQDPGAPAITIPVGIATNVDVCRKQYWQIEPDRVRAGDITGDGFPQTDNYSLKAHAVEPPVKFFSHTDSIGDLEQFGYHGFSRETVIFSVDLNGDEKADVVGTSFCCFDPEINPDKHDVDCPRCSAAFHRDREGRWIQSYQSEPC